MTDPTFHSERIVRQTITERVAAAERLRTVRRLRPSRRHALAQGLHRFADRLDL